MKTGLTKKQKVTELYFNENDAITEVYTHNTELKKRLLAYAAKYPELCQQTDDGQNRLCFEISKVGISIRLIGSIGYEPLLQRFGRTKFHIVLSKSGHPFWRLIACASDRRW